MSLPVNSDEFVPTSAIQMTLGCGTEVDWLKNERKIRRKIKNTKKQTRKGKNLKDFWEYALFTSEAHDSLQR